MIVQADVDKVFEMFAAEGTDGAAFLEFARVQTQLMLEMRDLLNEISERNGLQLHTLNSLWEKIVGNFS